jgi:SnoaL-like domain
MPSQNTLQRFIALVEGNRHVQAIEAFYADDASMQENEQPPRVGKAALIENEKRALAAMTPIESECVDPVFVNGDFVVIRWRFRFALPDGRERVLDELAYQHWRGEQIWREQFFYDPAQFAPRDNKT